MMKPKRVGISIDMTPFVDIAFLLLIFFMSTTVFKPPEEEAIALPDSHSEAKAPESGVITINVTKTPAVTVEWQKGPEKKPPYKIGPETIAAMALRDELSLVLRNARADAPTARVIVRMDKEAPYGVMADMMAALQDAKAPRFNVQTNLAADAGAFRPTAGGGSH
jgi:biopolymer transport protein ExbD